MLDDAREKAEEQLERDLYMAHHGLLQLKHDGLLSETAYTRIWRQLRTNSKKMLKLKFPKDRTRAKTGFRPAWKTPQLPSGRTVGSLA